MKIYFAEISEKENHELNNLLRFLSKEKREKLMRYQFTIDCKLSLYAELLVRKHVMQTLRIHNDDIKFGTNQYNKPFLQGCPEIKFNISHTRNAIVVAFSNQEVGVDIEKICVPDYQISKRFFCVTEQHYIMSSKEPAHAFYEIWTKKEAYIKWLGTGLTTPLNSFDVLEPRISKLLHKNKIGEYVISSCCDSLVTEECSCITLPEDELLYFFLKRI